MQRFNINWTAKTLTNQMAKGNVNFDNAVQRGLVWDLEKKSLLIHSMIYGYAIPAMYFTRDENGVYDSLDGKQRSNAISEYLNDEFALATNIPPVYDDDGNMDDVSGMSFSQLPEWAQDRIKDFNLTIYYYEGMTDQEVKEFFRRLNNGKPLSAIEITRVNTPSLEKFQDLAKHEAIQTVTTAAAKKRFTDEMIAMQLYHLVTVENPDFSTKPFREWVKAVEIDDQAMEAIKTGLDKYAKFIAGIDDKKLLKVVKARTHFISCAYYCYLSMQSGKTDNEISAALTEFFSGSPSVSDEYNKTVTAGSAKPGAVQTRKNVILELAGNVQRQNDDTENGDTADDPATENSTEEN